MGGATTARLEALTEGMAIPFGGDRVSFVDAALAKAFRPGDRLVVAPSTGELLHIPAADHALTARIVDRALEAFTALGQVSDAAVTRFFEAFAARLEDDAAFAPIAAANAQDVAGARVRSRAVGRLELTPVMRGDMIAGLRAWAAEPSSRGRVLERVTRPGFTVEQSTAPLGVVGFVFEGRPNVFADACGVLRGGNAAVFRIGSDALGTARAIAEAALTPALVQAGLPTGAVGLIESPAHAAGWALFADPRLSLAVARGSGPAVELLGAIARAAGTPVSLHGTGGAWMVADGAADPDRLFAALFHSLDRKVCNTTNVVCLTADAAPSLMPVVLAALEAAGGRRSGRVLHATPPAMELLPSGLAQPLAEAELGQEWEWDETPEVSLCVAADLLAAASLFNAWSPRLAASLISEDAAAQAAFLRWVDAPFTSDGFTRWVDGQYALDRPELGLSNWSAGRLFARSAILSGDGVHTVRTRVRQTDPDLDRGGAPTPERRR